MQQYWNDSAATYLSTNSYGLGIGSLQLNKGGRSNGIGFQTMFWGRGDGNNAHGSQSMQNNTGSYSSGFSDFSLYNNTGSDVIGIGPKSSYNNNYNGVISIGNNSNSGFVDGTISKTLSSTDINATAQTITIPSHGFGIPGKSVTLRYHLVSGVSPREIKDSRDSVMISDNTYQFDIVDANTLKWRVYSILDAGTNATMTLTKNVDITGSIAIGNNVTNTKSNQQLLGGNNIIETVIGGTLKATIIPTGDLSDSNVVQRNGVLMAVPASAYLTREELLDSIARLNVEIGKKTDSSFRDINYLPPNMHFDTATRTFSFDTNVPNGFAVFDGNGAITSAKYKLSALNTPPASATDTGTVGEIRIDGNYIYFCKATNIWVRTPLTW